MEPPGSHLVKFVFDEGLPFVDRAEGVFVHDTDGKRYLDGSAGAATVNIGHGHPAVLEAMREQAGRVAFVHRGMFHNAPAEALADRLSELTGYPYVFLCNSGSEAVESAIKFVMQCWREKGEPQRHRFFAHAVGYHGSTLGGLSASGHPLRRWPVEPLLHRFQTLLPPYAYRYAGGLDDAAFTAKLLDHATAQFDDDPAAAAGVLVEPVGGAAGGAIVPPDGYLPALAAACAERGLPLIADEVLCGLGRTGTMLAAEHWDVRPDVVVLGKGLGAGYTPIAAVLVTEEVVDTIATGSGAVTNGHTYGGNPLSCAVANVVLDVLVDEDLVANARMRGQQLRAGLDEIAARHEVIGEVRGLGLLQGIELVRDRATRAPGDPLGSLTSRVVTTAREHGLLVYPATGGVNDAVLVAPPLTITPGEIDLLLTLLDETLTAL